MNIGFDFDNTLISYEDLFYRIAIERELIPITLKKDKLSVKKFLDENGRSEEFTKIQGLVYGNEIIKAKPSENILDFLDKLFGIHGIQIYIISHKTKFPYIGEKINLRESANKWIDLYLNKEERSYFSSANVFYESTIEAKIARIQSLKCNYFFDDLPKIIELIPEEINGILYDPNDKYKHLDLPRLNNWSNLNINTFFMI